MIQSILVAISITGLVSLYLAWRESEKIRLNYHISLKSKAKRSAAVVALNVFLGAILYFRHGSLSEATELSLLLQFEYWTMFDIALNHFREKDLLYMPPKENKENSIFDKVFLKIQNPGLVKLVVQLIGIITFSILLFS